MGARDERLIDLYFEPTDDTNPTEEGQVRRVSGDLVAYISGQTKSLTTGTGLSEGGHRALDQQVHEIAENSYTEVTRTAGKVSNITVWTDNSKTTKIRETALTRTANRVSQVVTYQYDGTGTLVETYTEDITRSAGKIVSVDGVLT